MNADRWLYDHAVPNLRSEDRLFIVTEPVHKSAPDQQFNRAFAVDEILGLIATKGPPPFDREPTELVNWQAEVWPDDHADGHRAARILVDRFRFGERGNVTGAEFVLVIPTSPLLPARSIQTALDFALSTTGISRARLRGLRTHKADRAYVVIDLNADPAGRFVRTLQLMYALNHELEMIRPY